MGASRTIGTLDFEGPHYDVPAVGAGCAAAILFGRKGARVALVEPKTLPLTKKICTHYIQPSATPTIERLGLATAIGMAGGLRNEVELFTRWGWVLPPPTPLTARPAYGHNIRRQMLDPIVRNAAIATSGVDFMPGFSARELLMSDDRIDGLRAQGSDGLQREIEAGLVVGTDGRQSRIAELAALDAKTKPNGCFFYFAHYRNLPLKNGSRSQIWFLEPDIAYAFPNDGDVTLVAAMPEHAKLSPAVGRKATIESTPSPGGRVCQPFGRLEGPAAPHAPQWIDRKRRVAN